MKRPNNNQNQSQIEQEFWNYKMRNIFKTMISMLRALTEKYMKEKMGNVSREKEILRKSKRNTGDQIYYNRKEESLLWAY